MTTTNDPDPSPYSLSYQEVVYWLHSIDANRHDRSWLLENQDIVFHALRLGYTVNSGLPQKATRILLDISRHILTLPDPDGRWWSLYIDATMEALNRRDHALLLQIYTQFGQSSLQRGDMARARYLFDSIIANDPMLVTRPAWTSADWHLAEQKMLAYIGLIRVESWDYMRRDDQLFQDALKLAARLQDQLLTQMLYYALGTLYAHRKESSKAIGYALTSYAYALKREEPISALASILVLIVAYRKGGLYTKARQAIEFAQTLSERIYYPAADARIQYELAACDYYEQKFDSAENWVRKASATWSELGLNLHMTMCEHTLGNILLEQGQNAEAELLLLSTQANWDRFGNSHGQTTALADLAKLHWRSGNPDAARVFLQRALGTLAQVPSTPSREQLIQQIDAIRDALDANQKPGRPDDPDFHSSRSPVEFS